MKRVFSDYAYGTGPRDGCWWDETCDVPQGPALQENRSADVVVIGGGFTGITAALRLASSGVRTVVLEAESVGWGASGRNGGFCCLGGGIADDETLDHQYGTYERLSFRATEKSAVEFVEGLITRHNIVVDRHSRGETELAHRPKDMEALRRRVTRIVENYGVEPKVLEPGDLTQAGMAGGPFFGGLEIPIGFGLNPRKYLAGLVSLAMDAGAEIFCQSPALSIRRANGRFTVATPAGSVVADHVLTATNGYSSEDVPTWLAGRYLPVQSNVLVTRPLTQPEIDEQGWFSEQMSFDSRNLLHYFRLMPDRRFLFGMRGSLLSGHDAEARARKRTRLDFERMFPRWADVTSQNSWSGLVCLARRKVPFLGQIPDAPGLWTSMCYHGNGVAMASYCGNAVADLILGNDRPEIPQLMYQPLKRFPFGRARRILLPPVYAGLIARDRF